MANVTTSAETNVVVTSDLAKVREIDFVYRFADFGLTKLLEALGVTRKIPMQEGTALVAYKATGTLESGAVSEGEIIPLSHFATQKVTFPGITLNKWRKAVTAEAIQKSGYAHAVELTNDKMLKLAQAGIRTQFFDFLANLEGVTTTGADGLQAALAQAWGQLQVKFEDDTVDTVYFMNPLDLADYLGTATISLQTAFGMTYVENFLGLGTVITNTSVPRGVIYATAKDNIVLYYIPVNNGIDGVFNFTTDATGYIGIHEDVDYKRLQSEIVVISGITLFVERLDGVVVSMLDSTPTLGSVTVTSAAGTADGDSKITLSNYTLGSGEKWVYKTGVSAAPTVTYGQKLGSTWTEIDSGDDITPTATHTKIAVCAVDANNRVQAYGSATITVKS